MGALRSESCCGAASVSRIYCSTCASIAAWWESSKPTCFSKKNYVSVDCLVQLVLGVTVGGVEVVGVVVVFSMSVAGEASSRRRCRLGPIRALRVCMASDVSLPLVKVGDVLSEWLLCSSVSASFCWTALFDALRVAVFGSSVRCRIMWFLQRAKAC